MSPWESRSNELEPEHKHFSDYMAWEEWAREECHNQMYRYFDIDDLELLERVDLYALFVKAVYWGKYQWRTRQPKERGVDKPN